MGSVVWPGAPTFRLMRLVLPGIDSMWGGSPEPPAREAGTFVAKSRFWNSGKEKRGAARRAALGNLSQNSLAIWALAYPFSMWGGSPEPPAREADTLRSKDQGHAFSERSMSLCGVSGKEKRGAARRAALELESRPT